MALDTTAGRAVVVGSGMAGLFSTRVLSDSFNEVVLIDRDNIPEAPSTRAGVPQGRHFHALLPGGLNIACDLFPGFTEDLEAAGAVKCVAGQDFCAFRPEGKSYALAVYQPEPRPMGIIYFMSRALLEDCVRRRVEALPNVRTRYRSLVREPLIDGERVTGVIVDGGEPIPAELVVDATGRNARTIRWLTTLGFEAPVESVIHCDFAYASAVLRPGIPARSVARVSSSFRIPRVATTFGVPIWCGSREITGWRDWAGASATFRQRTLRAGEISGARSRGRSGTRW